MSGTPWAPLSEKQAAYIRRCRDCWLNVAEGGKRAGKNVINLIAWAATLETHPDALHLAAGVTQSAALLNILDSNGYGLKHLFPGRSAMCRYEQKTALRIKTRTGTKHVIVAGGHDRRSASLIKGASFGSVYITEINECDREFVHEAFSRTLASRRRKIFADLNPKPPAHWFYRDILDHQEAMKAADGNPGFNWAHFTIADNLSVSEDQLQEALRGYDRSSLWYHRDILGRRTGASGRIYAAYREAEVAVTREWAAAQKYRELSVGVDVGGTDATAAVLCGFTVGFERCVLIDGLWHRQGRDEGMDEAAYADSVAEWLTRWARLLPLPCTVYVDSANKLFRAALGHALARTGIGQRFAVRAFSKADGINERIKLNEALLAQGRFKVAAHLNKWHEAYQTAVWDERKYELGEWARLDDGSCPVDCLDSAEYAVYPYQRFLLTAKAAATP